MQVDENILSERSNEILGLRKTQLVIMHAAKRAR